MKTKINPKIEVHLGLQKIIKRKKKDNLNAMLLAVGLKT